jgi:hypothetical protein
LTANGLVFDSLKTEGERTERHVSRLVFLDANPNTEISARDETSSRVNYFIGSDPGQWHTGLPTSQAVIYKDLYPNIDLKVYGNGHRVEYDWIVKKGGHSGDIRFQYLGAEKTGIDEAGQIKVEGPFGDLKHGQPAAYQIRDGRRVDVAAAIGGFTMSTNFPVKNALQKTNRGKNEIFLSKLSPSGQSLVFSTYLGGSQSDFAFDLTSDESGSLYISGSTLSPDFPVLKPCQTKNHGLADIFIAKFALDGQSLVYSTYLGGSQSEYCSDLALDPSGVAYVVGGTSSTNFPVKAAYQKTHHGDRDAFVTKLVYK